MHGSHYIGHYSFCTFAPIWVPVTSKSDNKQTSFCLSICKLLSGHWFFCNTNFGFHWNIFKMFIYRSNQSGRCDIELKSELFNFQSWYNIRVTEKTKFIKKEWHHMKKTISQKQFFFLNLEYFIFSKYICKMNVLTDI